MRRLFALVCLATALAASPGAIAYDSTPAEKRIIPYAADLPTCGDPEVLSEITARFAEKEADYWRTNLTLVEYTKIQPLAWRPWGLDTIPRRYCTAAVTVSDGRRTRIDYSVREDLNFLGVGWGIEWCVLGLDRNLAYTPACRMARP